MSYTRCNYAGCSNVKRRSACRFYTFPVKDTERCEKWVLSCGNLKLLDIQPDQLKMMSVCENHFTEVCFMNETHNRLTHTAIPKIFSNPTKSQLTSELEIPQQSEVQFSTKPPLTGRCISSTPTAVKKMEVIRPRKTYARKRLFREEAAHYIEHTSPKQSTTILSHLSDVKTPPKTKEIEEDTPRKKNLKLKLSMKSKVMSKTRVIEHRLKKKLQNLSEKNILEQLLKPLSVDVKTFIKMQIFHKVKHSWTNNEKKISLAMYYKSPSLYRYLLNDLKFKLPAVGTIQKWLQIFRLKTGFSSEYHIMLRQKVEIMSEREKICVIMFDEISIKKSLDYNENMDLIEGYEDLGIELGRNNNYGKNALVFLARGLYDNWKMPLGYFICGSSTKGSNLKKILLSCLELTFSVGLNVKALVCDQGSNNRAVYKILGVTSQNPSFFYEQNKIYCLFDAPHLIKSVRNSLQKQDIFIYGKRVSWQDIKKTYEIDSKNKLAKSLVKITPKHIQPNAFEKMNVKLAVQVLSKSFSAAMFTVIATGELKSESALETAKFLETINNIFDCLNSRSLYSSNPYRSALSEKNTLVRDTLSSGIEWLQNWSVPKNTPYCFEGLIQTIKAILNLWSDMSSEYPFLITNRLCQDPLENLFSKIRQRRGYDPNPSTKHFRLALQSIMSASLNMTSQKSSYENDEDEYLFNIIEISNKSIDTITDTGHLEPETKNTDTGSSSSSSQDEISTLETCSINYFAGYLVHSVLKKFCCESCSLNLTKNEDIYDENEILMLNKDYGANMNLDCKLKRPTENVSSIVKIALKLFEKMFKKKPFTCNLKKYFLENLHNNTYISVWINEDINCVEHKKYIISHLFRSKIFHVTKTISKEIRSNIIVNIQSQKPMRKLRILKNK